MNRRRFLASTAGAASAVLAGCTSYPGGGGSGDANRPLEPVVRWALPVEAASEPIEGYSVRSVDPAAILSIDGGPSADVVANWIGRGAFVTAETDVDPVDRYVRVRPAGHETVGRYYAYEGDFDVEDLAGRIGTHPLVSVSEVGEYEGYDLYRTTTDGGSVTLYALSEQDAIGVHPRGGRSDDPTAIHRVVDAGKGRTDTIADQSPPAREIAERLSPGLQTRLSLTSPELRPEPDPARGLFEGVVASGSSTETTGETAEHRTVTVFESASTLAEADVDAWLERYQEADAVESVASETDGRVHELTVTIPAEDLYDTG